MTSKRRSIGKGAVRAGVRYLQSRTVDQQIRFLSDALDSGRLMKHELKDALEKYAHSEMSLGADRLQKKGEPVTVDALLAEYREDTGLKKLADRVGLDEAWFVALAEAECQSREEKGL